MFEQSWKNMPLLGQIDLETPYMPDKNTLQWRQKNPDKQYQIKKF